MLSYTQTGSGKYSAHRKWESGPNLRGLPSKKYADHFFSNGVCNATKCADGHPRGIMIALQNQVD
jgi:hypothetical protein